MLDMALKNIWQRKTRSLLTVLGVGMAVMLHAYLSTIMNFYDQDLQRTVSGFAGKVIVQAKSDEPARFPSIGSLIPMADADAVLARPDIDPDRSSAVLFEVLVPNPAPNMPPQVTAVGVSPGHEFAFRGDAETDGAAALSGADQVILGAKAADHYQKRVGDTLTLKGHDLQVVGILHKENELLDSAVLLPLETARQIFVRPGVVSAVMVTARTADQVESLAAAIEAANGQLAASTPAQMARTADELLESQRGFFATIRGTIIAVGIVVIMIVMIMAVAERKKEIGTLKALGASSGRVMMLILAEAVLLSLTGGLVAVLAAWLMTRDDHMRVDGRLAAQTVAVAVMVGALAALWPAWSAQRVDPIESLRHD